MPLTIGDTAPDFEAETSEGPIHFYDWLGDSWGVMFSHPKDFTPVCTTELGYMANIKPEFDKRNVKIIGRQHRLRRHHRLGQGHRRNPGHGAQLPDDRRHRPQGGQALRACCGRRHGDASRAPPADNATVRNVFVIGPDKKIKLVLFYLNDTGHNFDEVLRVVDSLQLTAKHKVATPVNWKHGDDVIIAGSVSSDQAKELFGEWQEPKPYIRIVPQPK